MTDLVGLLPEELEAFLAALGERAYRARQVFSWLHRGATFEQMTDLPAALRRRLRERAGAGSLKVQEKQTAPDGAAKFGFRTGDRHLVEAVAIPHFRPSDEGTPPHSRVTVCVSSQIGCAYRCRFCATGRQGLVRSLTAGEIVEQVLRTQQALQPRRVTNVVFMGMGEPLANYQAVMKAVRLLNHPWGLHIAARHIAISTCGLPEGIRRLSKEGLQVALAISLHAATDELRSQLVPINRKHPLAELMPAAKEYVDRTGRKVVFQYVVAGLNDTPEQAQRLARLLKGMAATVNLIPRNPVGDASRPNPRPAMAFAQHLRALGLEVAVRRSRGAEVLGACGQLRERTHVVRTGEESL